MKKSMMAMAAVIVGLVLVTGIALSFYQRYQEIPEEIEEAIPTEVTIEWFYQAELDEQLLAPSQSKPGLLELQEIAKKEGQKHGLEIGEISQRCEKLYFVDGTVTQIVSLPYGIREVAEKLKKKGLEKVSVEYCKYYRNQEDQWYEIFYVFLPNELFEEEIIKDGGIPQMTSDWFTSWDKNENKNVYGIYVYGRYDENRVYGTVIKYLDNEWDATEKISYNEEIFREIENVPWIERVTLYGFTVSL